MAFHHWLVHSLDRGRRLCGELHHRIVTEPILDGQHTGVVKKSFANGNKCIQICRCDMTII